MKKIFFVLIALMVSLSSYSQTFNMKATNFTWRTPGYEWSTWTPTNISVTMNMTGKTIFIYSQNPQMITFDEMEEEAFSDKANFKGLAIDGNGIIVGLNVTIYNSGVVFICISYSNMEYMYRLEFENAGSNNYM